eukprot:366339-Chlamydomonas_euryale.AAC.4
MLSGLTKCVLRATRGAASAANATTTRLPESEGNGCQSLRVAAARVRGLQGALAVRPWLCQSVVSPVSVNVAIASLATSNKE